MRSGEANKVAESKVDYESSANLDELLQDLEGEMKQAAARLEFEKAAHLRDEISRLRAEQEAG